MTTSRIKYLAEELNKGCNLSQAEALAQAKEICIGDIMRRNECSRDEALAMIAEEEKAQAKVDARIAIEKRIVRHLIRAAKQEGWECTRVNNGGDEDEPCTTEAEIMDAAFACDDARLYFRKEIDPNHGMTHWVYIVLGNDGWDVITDHSYAPEGKPSHGWNELMERVSDYCNDQDERA